MMLIFIMIIPGCMVDCLALFGYHLDTQRNPVEIEQLVIQIAMNFISMMQISTQIFF